MKKKGKKLVLSKETVRRLEGTVLPEVVGGATVFACNTIPCTTGCPSSPLVCQSGRYPC